MRANSTNVRRAGLLLRAMASGASWMPGVAVDGRAIARQKAIVGTDDELDDVERYMVDQGWLQTPAEGAATPGRFALTRHGLDEAHRKLPPEPKAGYNPNDASR